VILPLLLLVMLASIITLIFAYGILIEPRRLSITSHNIVSDKLPAGFDGMTIVQFSDTHIGPHYSLRQLQQLVTTINSLNPNIIVFTGDLFDARRTNNLANRDPSPILAQLQAPLGKYAVYGNHDFGYTRNKRLSENYLDRAGFKILINEMDTVTLPSGESIHVIGLDDYLYGFPEAQSTLASLSADKFHLLLVHEPDVADFMTRYPIDLQLSGHSHGGQVSLPIVGALIRTALGRKYVGGTYRLQDKLRNARPYVLHVNRGIGTTRIKIRIGSVPELSVFTLQRRSGV